MVAPFGSSYAGGLAFVGGPGGGGSLSASGGASCGGSGEVPLRTSLGIGGASDPVVPSPASEVPTSAVPGVANPLCTGVSWPARPPACVSPERSGRS